METNKTNMSVEQLLERILEQEVTLQEAQIKNALLERKLESRLDSTKQMLFRALGYVDKRSREILGGKKIEIAELEKILVVGIVSMKTAKERAERQNRNYEKSLQIMSNELHTLKSEYGTIQKHTSRMYELVNTENEQVEATQMLLPAEAEERNRLLRAGKEMQRWVPEGTEPATVE